MRISILTWTLAVLIATAAVGRGATEDAPVGDGGSIPYNGVRTLLRQVESTSIDGVDCGALFVKRSKKGEVLDPKKANFRLKSWDDEEHPLKCEALATLAAEKRSELVKRRLKEGYTHQLWIPRDEEKFLDGEVVHSLPKDSIGISTAMGAVRIEGTQVKLIAPEAGGGKGRRRRGATQADNRSIAELKKAAVRGDAKAKNNLGYMYWEGQSVPQDFKKAFDFYSSAAKQGLPGAKYNLGVLYDEGQGVRQDKKKAVELYLAAAQGGFSGAQYKLGQMYFQGDSVSQDFKKSFGWYLKAAEQEDVDAQYTVGKMYGEGVGIPRDNAKALSWYLKAALQGDAGAQNNLAVGYYYGRGVAQDFKQAYAWAHVAEASGHPGASRMKRVLSLENLTPQELENAKRKGEEFRRMSARK